MAVPDYQTLMLPALRASANGESRISDIVETLSKEFNLTDDERTELLPSGSQSRFANRVNWAISYLFKAGLVDRPQRGHVTASIEGRNALERQMDRIDIKYLQQFESFAKFIKSDSPSEVGTPALLDAPSAMPPNEMLRAAHAKLEEQLAKELLDLLLISKPDFFERMLVQLLVAMGYGGSIGSAARSIGRSGDGGVDGVIDQDALGLDRVYIQAKRYSEGNNIGSGAIREFFGSLDRFKAAKGVFVTTSRFSSSAKETAEQLSKRIVLIDGTLLTQLMIRYDIGCRIEETLHIKKVDEDFFE